MNNFDFFKQGVCKAEPDMFKVPTQYFGIFSDQLVKDGITRIRNTNRITDVQVIVPEKVVKVFFGDGTSERAVCAEGDVFNLETAISICITKKIMGGTKAYNKAVKEGLKVYEGRLKREENDRVEQERITRKRAKRKAYKERREAKRLEEEVKRKQKEREEQIEIQAEAYIRAMKCMNDTEQKGQKDELSLYTEIMREGLKKMVDSNG